MGLQKFSVNNNKILLATVIRVPLPTRTESQGPDSTLRVWVGGKSWIILRRKRLLMAPGICQ